MSNIYDKASLVLIPSGTKTSKVYSQKPVNGDGDFTFSRSTAATRVNADGNIEKETQNLLLQSQTFGTTWVPVRSSIIENTTADPNGGNNADSLIEDTTASNFHYISQSVSAISGVYTYSVYAKANTRSQIQLAATGGTTKMGRGYDLSSGTLFGETIGGVVSNDIDQSITDVGNGWYRCTMTWNATGQDNLWIVLSVSNAGSYTGDGTSGLYIWGAQLEQGLVARDYIETTTAAVEGGITDNVPRLDYTDSSCPALLLEPQRTNVFTNSEYFNGSDWILQDATLTNNAAISPEGVQNASLYTTTSDLYDFVRQNISFVSGTTYTYSVFAKAGTSSLITLAYHSAAFGTGQSVEFDLSDGTYTIGNGTPSVKVEDFGDGWYRCAITATATAASTRSTGFSSTAAGAVTTLYLYGAQMEASASYATSYIPTYGTSVTRNADDCSTTGISSLYGSSVGTLFYEGVYGNEPNEVYLFAQDVLGTATTNSVYLQRSETNKVQAQVWDGTNQVAVIKGGNVSIGDTFKAAVAFADNDVVLYLNGLQIGTDTNVNIPPLTSLQIGRYPSSNDFRYKTSEPSKQVLVFPTRLSNEELAALTTI